MKIFHIIFKVLIIQIITILPCSVKSQPFVKDLRTTGNSVQFIYTTIEDDYKLGITLTDRTILKIRYKYIGHPNWELRLNALDASIAYEGNSSHDIPLSDLELAVTAVGATPASPFVLTESPQVLVSGGGGEGVNPAEFTITISYTLPSMINKPEGLYFVNLYFLLVEEGG